MATLSTRGGAESLKSDIERLKTLDVEALRVEWRTLYGKRAPKSLPKSLLVKAIAYRLQAVAFGDLDPQTLRVLEAYAAKGEGRSKGRVRADRLSGASSSSTGPHIKPGCVLVREWAGEIHRVTVVEVGFAWNGGTYRSLSEVARAITGTRWNGPRFFGLDRKRAAKDTSDNVTRGRRNLYPDKGGKQASPAAHSRRLGDGVRVGETAS
jgi:Protein of unknown function (DUF2924)